MRRGGEQASLLEPMERRVNRPLRQLEDAAAGATEFHTLVGNFILCAILGKKPAFGDAIKNELA